MNRNQIANATNARLLGIAGVVVIIAGFFAHSVIAYYCIALPVVAQAYLWLRGGARGLPVLPLIFALFYVYYAIPLLRGESAIYTPEELATAGFVVGSFLITASVCAAPFLVGLRRRIPLDGESQISDRQVVPIIYVGLASGILYHLAVFTSSAGGLGTFLGTVRSLMLTLAAIACYLIGYARARLILREGRWIVVSSGLIGLVLLTLTNLLLTDGLVLCLAAILGYVLTRGRIPWVAVTVATGLLVILHAGKFQVRDEYWVVGSSTVKTTSVTQIPGMMLDWLVAGVEALGSDDVPSDFLQRASLLHMLLLVQRNTPEVVPYLNGETYSELPALLLPRFFDPDKPTSQAGLNLLSIHYGLQTEDSVGRTTIGWGLVAEANANFGYWAVVVVGAIFGALCGGIMWLSAGTSTTSLRMIVTMPATLVLSNVEANFAYLIVTLMQAVVAAVVLVSLSKLANNLFEKPQPAAVAQRAGAPYRSLPSGSR